MVARVVEQVSVTAHVAVVVLGVLTCEVVSGVGIRS